MISLRMYIQFADHNFSFIFATHPQANDLVSHHIHQIQFKPILCHQIQFKPILCHQIQFKPILCHQIQNPVWAPPLPLSMPFRSSQVVLLLICSCSTGSRNFLNNIHNSLETKRFVHGQSTQNLPIQHNPTPTLHCNKFRI